VINFGLKTNNGNIKQKGPRMELFVAQENIDNVE
jgi:hypothetical protein